MNLPRLAAGFLFTIGTGLASARGTQVYSQEVFDRLAADKKPILLAVQAPWCPIDYKGGASSSSSSQPRSH